MTRTAVPSAFDRLRTAATAWMPLDPLDPVEYARGHALFEARSDQRAQLTDWLVRTVSARAERSTRVLSIGCGDGSVDVQLATALAARDRHVDYVGVEPHLPSAMAFASRLAVVPGVDVAALNSSFAQAQPTGKFDVVLAVHSLYYVADLAATLQAACGLLAPGGELLILHAPREPLNALVRLLAPGRRQAFSDEVAAASAGLGQAPAVTRLESRLDLGGADATTDRDLLAFTVQAHLPYALQPLIRAALAERAEPGPGLVLSHPVDALVVRQRLSQST